MKQKDEQKALEYLLLAILHTNCKGAIYHINTAMGWIRAEIISDKEKN